MPTENLDEKVQKTQTEKEKSSFWDFFVSAYSANKALKTGLYTAAAGVPLGTSALASAGTYLGLKTAGYAIKYTVNVVRNPFKYLRPAQINKELSSMVKNYNPIGRLKTPTGIGAGIQGLTYATGY